MTASSGKKKLLVLLDQIGTEPVVRSSPRFPILGTNPPSLVPGSTLEPNWVGNRSPLHATTSNIVVAGNISIASQYAYVLFDYGAKHSFISTKFARKLDVLPKPLEFQLRVDTPTNDFLVVGRVFKRDVLQIDSIEMLVDLVEKYLRF